MVNHAFMVRCLLQELEVLLAQTEEDMRRLLEKDKRHCLTAVLT